MLKRAGVNQTGRALGRRKEPPEKGAFLRVPNTTRADSRGSSLDWGLHEKGRRETEGRAGVREELISLGVSHAVAARCWLKLPSSEGSTGLGVHSGTRTFTAGA